MPERGDILELTVESTGFEGTSIARHDGMVVFVEGAVAGDVVRSLPVVGVIVNLDRGDRAADDSS